MLAMWDDFGPLAFAQCTWHVNVNDKADIKIKIMSLKHERRGVVPELKDHWETFSNNYTIILYFKIPFCFSGPKSPHP